MINKTSTSTVTHVWSVDSALDRSDKALFDSKYAEFLKTGDMSQLPIRAGCVPAVFTIRSLTRRVMMRLGRYSSPLEFNSEVVAYTLVGVTGYEVNGRPVELGARVSTDIAERLGEAALDQIYDPFLFAELADRAVEISRVDPTRAPA